MKQCNPGYIWDPFKNKCVRITGRYSGTWWGVYIDRNGKKKNGKNGNGNGNGSHNGNGGSNGHSGSSHSSGNGSNGGNGGGVSEGVEVSNWRDDFNPTEYEFIDIIKPDPIEVPEPTVEWEDPLDLQEVRRLPKYNKPGNIIEVYLAWRGRTMSIQMFFPQVKKPSRKEVVDQLQKVYPGAKLWSYRIADYDPETPLFQKAD